MEDNRSSWDTAKSQMHASEVTFGEHVGYWLLNSPRRLLHSMSYYKFAAKMIGSGKSVLDVGCGEGIGTFLLGKECGTALGMDFDSLAIDSAIKNFGSENCKFECADFLKKDPAKFDAIVNFDVIEHIMPENAGGFIQGMADSLHDDGIVVLGTPSQISQQFASEIAKVGHVNIYDPARLLDELDRHFKHVFLFSANDEMVHTGYLPLAHYYIALACRPIRH